VTEKVVVAIVQSDFLWFSLKPCHIEKPGGHLTLHDKEVSREDVIKAETAKQHGVNFVVLERPMLPEDYSDIREQLYTKHPSNLVISMSSAQSIDAADEIIGLSDGILLGRGTLSLETSTASVCSSQKLVIEKCRALHKPVIATTEIMEHMELHPQLNSAEIADIVNAVQDGCDAILLSAATDFTADSV
jgi:pyruvate kinase